MGRAENRHHQNRIKEKVKKYYDGWAGKNKKKTGLVASTKKLCSCLSCGNKRKYEGETLQEKRIKLSEKEN